MRLYTLLLALYPRDVRSRFGAGMRAAFAEDYERARARGRVPALLFLTSTILHTVPAALAERLPRAATLRSFLSADLRDAVRSLRATPVVIAVAVLSLALGIGANTALFSILYSLVLKPLPVAEPHRLAVLAGNDWTNPIWEEIRARQSALFDSAFAWSRERFNLAPSGPADPVDGAYVSGGMFDALGITTVVGRPLTAADDVRGGNAQGYAAVISHRFWTQRFAGSSDAIGRAISVNGVPFTIVGVSPPGFLGPEVGQAMDVFLPLAAEGAIRGINSALDGRSSWWLQVMIRLDPEQTIAGATAALNAARPAIREATIPLDAPEERRAGYLKDDFVLESAATGISPLRNRFAQPLTVIMCVVAAVLLITCANIANLMLARASSRRREMSVRLALGASRLRLGGQVLVESLLLAGAGAVSGLVMAQWGAALLVRQLGTGASSVTLDLSPDWRVLGFTALVALSATLLFGLAPALGLGGVSPGEVLKEQSRSVRGERRFGLRGALVVVQIAISFALVAGAGLFVRTFATLVSTPLGFDPDRLLIVGVDARKVDVPPDQQVAYYQRVTEAIAATPGVSRASLSFMTPMSGRGWNGRVEIEGGPVRTGKEQVAWINAVAPGWFETYGMRLVAGRDIADSDASGGEEIAVVNEAFVRKFAAPGSPIGQRMTLTAGPQKRHRIIVGVVNDAVYRTARAGVVPTMYVPMTQGGPYPSALSVTAKMGSERQSVERSIAETIRRIDPRLAVAYRDYSEQVRSTVAQERLVALLAGFFGGLAMLLAALGLYGVTSYWVSRRRPELAVRMALGASGGRVVWMVVRRIAILLVAGIAIGTALIAWAGKFIATLLFRVDARDPLTIGGAAVILVTVGLLAGWLPARGLSRLDPTTALRESR
jgi:putative ABC transport system permease protein